jgi:predicted NUDIX family NTP pyrophosphohydrolase
MHHVSTYTRPINGTNQSAIDTWHAQLQHDVYNTEYPFVTTETKSWKKLDRISRFQIEHFKTKAKLADFKPMFHGEPAGIRSRSSEPVVIRSRRLEL